MAGILDTLLTSFSTVFGSALISGNGSAMLIAAGVTVAVGIAVLALVQAVLGAANEAGAARSTLGNRLDIPAVLPQSDPDAPGRARPRAPGLAASAA